MHFRRMSFFPKKIHFVMTAKTYCKDPFVKIRRIGEGVLKLYVCTFSWRGTQGILYAYHCQKHAVFPSALAIINQNTGVYFISRYVCIRIITAAAARHMHSALKSPDPVLKPI